MSDVNRADRLANLTLLVLAGAAWLSVGVVFIALDPVGNTGVLLAGALLLGAAAALTLAPLLWMGGFVVRGPAAIAYRGDWWRAARRALLVGLGVTLLVLLRGQGLLTPALTLFVVAMAVVIELTLWRRR